MMSRTNVFPQTAHSMARGLGWFSIGLGLAELLAPRTLTRGLGMEGNEQIVQAYGGGRSLPGSGFCPRITLRRGYGGALGGTRSTSRRSQPDCNRTIRKKTMSNLLLSPLPELQRLMSSAEPRWHVV